MNSIKLSADTIFVGCTHADHALEAVWKKRGFRSIQEHADWLCHEIDAYHKAYPTASMVHLGDGFLNSTPDRAATYFRRWQMPILYLWGNHESPTRRLCCEWLRAHGFGDNDEVYPLTLDSLPNVTFLGPQATFLIEKQPIFAHHFPFAIWDHSHHGVWHVHSHNHHSFPASHREDLSCKRLDCGVDSCKTYFNTPYITFRQLKEIMDKKGTHVVDHHNRETT